MNTWADRLRGRVQGEAPRTRRAAVLSPGPRGWLGLPLVRALRVCVEGGAVVVHHPGGRTERRAAPGEVTRIVLLTDAVLALVRPPGHASAGCPAAEHGLLVLLAGDRPVLALWVSEWVPGPAYGLDDVLARRLAGVEALAAALGQPVEPAGQADVAAWVRLLDRVTVSTVPAPGPGRRALLRLAYAVLVLFGLSIVGLALAAPIQEYREVAGPLPYPAPLAWLAGLAAAGLIVGGLSGRLRASRLIQQSPVVTEPDGWVPRPSGPVPAGFLGRARLVLRPDAVIVRDGDGREAWLPGPGLGGIDHVVLTDDELYFVDGSGVEHLALMLSWWAGTDPARSALRGWLTAGGLSLTEGLPGRRPIFAAPDDAGALTLPSYGALREPTGFPAGHRAAVLIAAALTAGAVGLTLGGPVGTPVALLSLLAGTAHIGASAVHAAAERGRRRAVVS